MFSSAGIPSSGPGPTVHLVGPGRVGRAFLGWLAAAPFRLVGVTDSTATRHDRSGLSPAGIRDFKAAGGSLQQHPDAEALPVNLAVELVDADVLVDATPTTPGQEGEAIQRGQAVVDRNRVLVLAAKDALCRMSTAWLGLHRGVRVGCNAVLGGTGLPMRRELDELRRSCREVVLVPNASTTAILDAIEGAATLDEGIGLARDRGLLEADPGLDLDGSDAAVKLAIVAAALWQTPVSPEQVERQDIRSLDLETVRRRARSGRTTRLVARARACGALRVAYEELPRTSPLATPADRVAYGYVLESGTLRVHSGVGLGPVETGRALLEDVLALAGEAA